MNNRDVVQAWASSEVAQNGDFYTDGLRLWSGDALIGITWRNLDKVACSWRGRYAVDHATSIRVGLALAAADVRVKPESVNGEIARRNSTLAWESAAFHHPELSERQRWRAFHSISEIIEYDTLIGGHFFSAANMRFACSRVLSGVYHAPGRLNVFVTSERDRFAHGRRCYTVRELRLTGVHTVGGYQAYTSARAAIRAIETGAAFR